MILQHRHSLSHSLTHSRADRRTNEFGSFLPWDQLKGTPPHTPNLLNNPQVFQAGLLYNWSYSILASFSPRCSHGCNHDVTIFNYPLFLEGTEICCCKRVANTQPIMMIYCPWNNCMHTHSLPHSRTGPVYMPKCLESTGQVFNNQISLHVRSKFNGLKFLFCQEIRGMMG